MMDENVVVPGVDEDVSFDERFASLEHQCYLMYLQLNAITQLLVNNSTLSKDDIGKQMDGMHTEIEKAVEELQSEVESPTEDVAE